MGLDVGQLLGRSAGSAGRAGPGDRGPRVRRHLVRRSTRFGRVHPRRPRARRAGRESGWAPPSHSCPLARPPRPRWPPRPRGPSTTSVMRGWYSHSGLPTSSVRGLARLRVPSSASPHPLARERPVTHDGGFHQLPLSGRERTRQTAALVPAPAAAPDADTARRRRSEQRGARRRDLRMAGTRRRPGAAPARAEPGRHGRAGRERPPVVFDKMGYPDRTGSARACGWDSTVVDSIAAQGRPEDLPAVACAVFD
ncbi:hypothetical protein FB470_005509 [Amycolatopsis thermophila]|uniref:Uncharacterized protein n=1 Tax=Amycolatopsis thermophila TaxID=206084 RepID=A0ABU0F1Q3_9PSEU|nr:hypothetical protein [Amycolatopsis thermophila]